MRTPPRVFISYRRGGSSGTAGRLYDALITAFGVKNVFMDVADLSPGTAFEYHIRLAIKKCDVALAVIGPDFIRGAKPPLVMADSVKKTALLSHAPSSAWQKDYVEIEL